jgi:peptide/nickel transport system ATP-binding protein
MQAGRIESELDRAALSQGGWVEQLVAR